MCKGKEKHYDISCICYYHIYIFFDKSACVEMYSRRTDPEIIFDWLEGHVLLSKNKSTSSQKDMSPDMTLKSGQMARLNVK